MNISDKIFKSLFVEDRLNRYKKLYNENNKDAINRMNELQEPSNPKIDIVSQTIMNLKGVILIIT